jgi:hypothetical protein
MNKTILLLAFAVASSTVFAQGRGRPAATGIEHAESVASPHGDKGLDNAEAKQSRHKKEHSRKHKLGKSHHRSAS